MTEIEAINRQIDDCLTVPPFRHLTDVSLALNDICESCPIDMYYRGHCLLCEQSKMSVYECGWYVDLKHLRDSVPIDMSYQMNLF